MNMHDDSIDLKGKDMGDLTDELGLAAKNFNACFDEYEDEINAVTTTPFVGEAAESLKEQYTTKVKPSLDEVVKTTRNVENDMSAKTEAFGKLVRDLSDRMRG